MRRKAGLGIMLAGILVALFGVAIMAVLGPDGRIKSGPHEVDTDGIAIVTAPRVISWTGARVGVFAELPVNKPVFVGLGNSLDVENYVGETAHLQIDSYHVPWKTTTREIKGRPNLPAAPTAMDWWIAENAGLGGASISTRLPDETVSLAILSVGSSNLTGLKVTVTYEIKGGFGLGGGLILLGIGAVLFGRMYRSDVSLWPSDADADEDDVVYIYTDENGVEHEISEDELHEFEVEDTPIDDEPHTDGRDIPGPTPDLESEPAEPVVYVYVDDEGVEHEVGEDSLEDYEVVDGPDGQTDDQRNQP